MVGPNGLKVTAAALPSLCILRPEHHLPNGIRPIWVGLLPVRTIERIDVNGPLETFVRVLERTRADELLPVSWTRR
jgi:hypothetical protein